MQIFPCVSSAFINIEQSKWVGRNRYENFNRITTEIECGWPGDWLFRFIRFGNEEPDTKNGRYGQEEEEEVKKKKNRKRKRSKNWWQEQEHARTCSFLHAGVAGVAGVYDLTTVNIDFSSVYLSPPSPTFHNRITIHRNWLVALNGSTNWIASGELAVNSATS